ncbi:RNA polymerase sigma factor [Actinomadura geliboluensis]|uniref:RNA polymerase sigma factor n=1 Tax=Actinomadura geliboluensis TaxID=882440 RepID=UPI0036B9D307
MVQTDGDAGQNAPTPPARFKEFYRTFYREMLKVAKAAGAVTDQEAEDVVQDAMTDVYKNWASITSPRTYAATAVRRAIAKAQRHERFLIARMIERGHHDPVGKDDSGLAACDTRQHVQQILNQLTPGQRQVISLLIEGLAYDEIAEALGKTPAAVRKQAQLGRDHLKQTLRDEREDRMEPAQAGQMRKEAR